MNESATLLEINEVNFWLLVYDDPFNKRIRIDDYYGGIAPVIDYVENLMKEKKREKLIIKVRSEHFKEFLERGFTCEAIIDHYYLGSTMYFFTKYFDQKRNQNDHWITEDQILGSINGMEISTDTLQPPNEYHLKKVDATDAEKLALLYQTVFKIYPTPLHDSEYIKETIEDGTIYYAFYCNGAIVSAASAEVNRMYRNAELTDCATLTEHRKHGLMKILLKKLELELFDQGIYCSYSIARSLSFGMNAVLHQLGYRYRGRLKNNVFIYDKLENMNVWVKNLADTPNFRQ
ncbi:putative beta-lysine N-acetyltransferase [Pseudoneobacillus rhizosphaerae]|uniref:N-acetyltransferase YodP n=1 Tax=Pseudoneobacillus rhizosphaerae TaxID=2880968 RepID=A0A9C7G984_9BACI|nr:putative beta-lysine N-acetyltransferase [Pseudoneobacillus rhizosphaerae]CAG9608174.1 N-acetyltransferase YodP [Pseudoneobacillus rhizosphaerae]